MISETSEDTAHGTTVSIASSESAVYATAAVEIPRIQSPLWPTLQCGVNVKLWKGTYTHNRLALCCVHGFGVRSKRDIVNPSPHRDSLAVDQDSGSFTHVLCLFRQNMFTVESVNCICVDWKSGSRTAYTQASQNIRIVGAEVAYFVQVLQVTCMWKPVRTALWTPFQRTGNAVGVIITRDMSLLSGLSPWLKKERKKKVQIGLHQ